MQNPPDSKEVGYQIPHWATFYENAWAFRANFINEMLKRGESDPLRLIGLLNSKERKYQLKSNTDKNETIHQKYTYDNVNLCPAGVPFMRVSSFRGNFVQIPFYVDVPLFKYVIDYFDEKGPFDCIVELGCGIGINLFNMYYLGGPNVPYFGGEFTDSGVQIARKLASLDPNLNMRFFPFNHLKPDLSPLPRFKRVLFFTMHTIEQVNRITTELFSTIAQSAEAVTCLHFEPFGFQLESLGDVTLKQKKFFEEVGWNVNLGPMLHAASDQGIIRLEYVDLELFYPSDPMNATSVAIWHAGKNY